MVARTRRRMMFWLAYGSEFERAAKCKHVLAGPR